MSDPRLTEERLRCHLDANQVMRERLCAALLPALGPYSNCELRRPKGGPDGGRDIEALFRESTPAWAGVGFRNGGGNDTDARRWASDKFTSDLTRALEVNPSLSAFAFLTNVDLSPSNVTKQKTAGYELGVSNIDVFHLENLRYALDSAEGLIARLQFLNIPMSDTEQVALVSKYGAALQDAVSERFDKVDHTLAEMKRFIDFQMPIARIDIFIRLKDPISSAMLGRHALLIRFARLSPYSDKTESFLTVNATDHEGAREETVARTCWWRGSDVEDGRQSSFCLDPKKQHLVSFCGYGTTDIAGVLTLAKIPMLNFSISCTSGFESNIESISVDANRYQLLKFEVGKTRPTESPRIPGEVDSAVGNSSWVAIVEDHQTDFFLKPPVPQQSRYDPTKR